MGKGLPCGACIGLQRVLQLVARALVPWWPTWTRWTSGVMWLGKAGAQLGGSRDGARGSGVPMLDGPAGSAGSYRRPKLDLVALGLLGPRR